MPVLLMLAILMVAGVPALPGVPLGELTGQALDTSRAPAAGSCSTTKPAWDGGRSASPSP